MNLEKQKTALVTGLRVHWLSYFKRSCPRLEVVGLDCMSDYYDVSLKERREGMLLQNASYRSVHEKLRRLISSWIYLKNRGRILLYI